jgi:hypothetical protein
VHDFKPLIEYVRNLEEKPDIIVYAGDDIRRFCPLPLDNIAFESLYEGSEHPPMLESVCINYEYCSISSYGFILHITNGLEIDVKNKLKQIKSVVYLEFNSTFG